MQKCRPYVEERMHQASKILSALQPNIDAEILFVPKEITGFDIVLGVLF
jgi:hypothetical protein